MRALFFLLILGNLIFFAWTEGYLGTADAGREPQRQLQQLQPEKLRVVRADQSAATTKTASGTCRKVGSLTLAEAEALKTAMEAAQWDVRLIAIKEPGEHLVVIPDLASKALADKKAGELRLLGVEGFTDVALADGRHEIVLGRFDSVAAASGALQALAAKNVKSARVDSREPPVLNASVEARAPAETLVSRLPELIAPYANAAVGECAAP